MRCPQCNERLIFQAFWQGRFVNCTACGARLQRGIVGMVMSYASGIAALALAEMALIKTGVPIEIEIPASLIAIGLGFFAVHAATLRLKPRDEEPTLKLR